MAPYSILSRNAIPPTRQITLRLKKDLSDDLCIVRTFAVDNKRELFISLDVQDGQFVDFVLQGLHLLAELVQF